MISNTDTCCYIVDIFYATSIQVLHDAPYRSDTRARGLSANSSGATFRGEFLCVLGNLGGFTCYNNIQTLIIVRAL